MSGNPAVTAHSSRTGALEIEFAQLSDPGRVREQNEDYLGFCAPANPAEARRHGWLFALADGVGGHDLGEIASREAVETVLTGFRGVTSGEPGTALLSRLIRAANLRVYEKGRSACPGGIAMATTIVACAIRFDRAAIAHVGDSRCYLVRRGRAAVLTRDHTFAAEQVRLGLVSAGEVSNSDTRHVLSRSLGSDLFVNVEVSEHQVLPGDVLVLCSDGLHGAVSLPELAGAAESPHLAASARRLIDLANNRSGGDNISVQLIRVRSVEAVGMYRGRPYRLH